MKSQTEINAQKTIKILVCPSHNGFSCAIDIENSKNLNPEEYELVSKIARGLVFQATTDPHSTFLMGVKGFKNDKDKKRDLKKKETKKEQNNVIDFIDYLKKLRDK
jgi:glucose dehydrogenase